MSIPFRFSVCNEIYQKWDFAEACRSIKRLGWDGIELAHFTLAESPLDISPERRRERLAHRAHSRTSTPFTIRSSQVKR